MSMSVGASSSNALSYLQSLLQQGTSGAGDAKKSSASDPLAMLMQAISGDGTSSGQTSSTATSSNTTTGSNCPQFSPDTMSALLSAQGQQSTDSPSAKLFAKLDADGDGTISKTEFADAASNAGADSSVANAVFAKIDGDGDGSVSQSELTKADQGSRHGHIGGGPPPSDGGSSGTSAAANGATTSTTTNADGSTTTSITYADGSKVTMTTAAT
ncbi:MAG: EF-hand domain-containing protein, partial [Pseudolabrys sp.]|nr:EF-hand domain-containing protein [Pseudolabrys sp.]